MIEANKKKIRFYYWQLEYIIAYYPKNIIKIAKVIEIASTAVNNNKNSRKK